MDKQEMAVDSVLQNEDKIPLLVVLATTKGQGSSVAKEEKASEVRDEDPMVESLDEKHWRLYLYVRVVLGPPSLVKKKFYTCKKSFI